MLRAAQPALTLTLWLLTLSLRLVGALLAGVRLLLFGVVRGVEVSTSPARLSPLAWGARAGTLLLAAGASLAGLWAGARTRTELDPSPWWPHGGPGGDAPPAGSYLTSPGWAPSLLADGRRLHHVTVATHGEEGLARQVRSASWHGARIKVLGVGDARLLQWGVGFGVKVECFLAYAASVPPEDLLLFTDAYDVVLWGGHGDVAAGYDAALARHAREADPIPGGTRPPPTFLISTESAPTSWGGVDYGPRYPPADRAPGVHFPYLNSGAFMGPAKAWLEFLGAARMDMDNNDQVRGGGAEVARRRCAARGAYPTSPPTPPPQAFFNDLFLASQTNASLPRVALDHANDVFLSLTRAPPARESVASHIRWDPVSRRWRHASTGGAPAIFHSPGWARWKQVDEAWGLAQGRACGGYTASPLQWPPLAAIALDAALGAGAAGALLGLALPLARAAAGRSEGLAACGRAAARARARAAALPMLGILVAGACGEAAGGGAGAGAGAAISALRGGEEGADLLRGGGGEE